MMIPPKKSARRNTIKAVIVAITAFFIGSLNLIGWASVAAEPHLD